MLLKENMAGPVDTTPAAQGKRKRSQKDKTPVSQGTKRVKSEHEKTLSNGQDAEASEQQATPVPVKQSKTPATTSAQKAVAGALAAVKKSAIETPSKKTTQTAEVTVPGSEKSKRLRRPTKKERRQSTVAETTILKEAPAPAEAASLWSVSRPTGGRFIAHDPIMSEDDRYVLSGKAAMGA